MPRIVRAFPVLPGRESKAKEFAAAVSTSRRQEVGEFYRQFGITRETWHLQDTGDRTWVIVVTELEQEPQAAGQALADTNADFGRWFKDQVRQLSGIDQDRQPLGPPTELLVDFVADDPAAT